MARIAHARGSLERKIALLESWVKEGALPPSAPTLDGEKNVREWRDEELNLSSWVSFSILAPGGPNADLRLRLDSVLPLYQQLRAGPSKQGKARRGKSISDQQIRRERDRLAVQNEQLLCEVARLTDEVILSHQEITRLRKDNSEITAKLRGVATFSVTKRS